MSLKNLPLRYKLRTGLFSLPLQLATNSLSEEQRKKADEAFNNYGPTIRVVLQAIDDEKGYREYTKLVFAAIGKLKVMSEFVPLLSDSGELSTSTNLSHKLCLIRRPTISVTTGDHIVHVVSLYVQTLLLTAYRELEFRDQMRLYRSTSRLSFARTLVGRFFEEYCHANFGKDGIYLEYVEMVRRNAKKNTQCSPGYHSSHCKLSDNRLEELRQVAVCRSLTIKSVSIRTYNDQKAKTKLKPGRYYIPAASNQVVMDSFILIDDTLYVFQFTIAKSHDVKAGIVPFLESMSQFHVVFIFVIPSDLLVLKCSYPNDAHLRKLTFHSARVRVSADTVC